MPIRNPAVVARRQRSSAWSIAAGLTGVLLAGCGQAPARLAEVAGSVSLDGHPVPNVMVEFQPSGGAGSPSVGYTDRDGRYRLRFSRDRWGAVPGPHVVRIDFDLAGNASPTRIRIPAQYNRNSRLHRELRPGHNHLMFDLCSCGGTVDADTSNLAQESSN